MLFIRNLSTKIKTVLTFLKNIACWNAEMSLKYTTITRFNFQMMILLKELPLSLKTMEVQIKGDQWNKRFRTVQVYWKNLAGYASQNIVTTVTLTSRCFISPCSCPFDKNLYFLPWLLGSHAMLSLHGTMARGCLVQRIHLKTPLCNRAIETRTSVLIQSTFLPG